MKKTLLFISLLIGFTAVSFAQEQIEAGQTTGDNIHYQEFDPVLYINANPSYEEFSIDVNFDGNPDFLFSTNPNNTSMGTTLCTKVEVLNENATLYGENIDHNLAMNVAQDELISEDLLWPHDGPTEYILSYYSDGYPPMYTSQEFGYLGFGYIAFKIETSLETMYGWIYVEATNLEISVYRFGIYSRTISSDETPELDNQLKMYPNPCETELTIELPSASNEATSYVVFNSLGQIVSSGKLSDKLTILNTNDLPTGMYILQTEGAKIQHKRFIKK